MKKEQASMQQVGMRQGRSLEMRWVGRRQDLKGTAEQKRNVENAKK